MRTQITVPQIEGLSSHIRWSTSTHSSAATRRRRVPRVARHPTVHIPSRGAVVELAVRCTLAVTLANLMDANAVVASAEHLGRRRVLGALVRGQRHEAGAAWEAGRTLVAVERPRRRWRWWKRWRWRHRGRWKNSFRSSNESEREREAEACNGTCTHRKRWNRVRSAAARAAPPTQSKGQSSFCSFAANTTGKSQKRKLLESSHQLLA